MVKAGTDSRHGRLVQEYHTNFAGATLPSWLELDSPASGNTTGSSIAAPSKPGGGLDLITGYVAGSTRVARLKGTSAVSLNLNDVEMVELDLVMTGGGENPSGDLGLSVAMWLRDSHTSPTLGCGLIRSSTSSVVNLRTYSPSQTNVDSYAIWGGADLRFRHTLRVWPGTRLLQWGEGNAVHREHKFTAANFLGVVTPAIELTKTTAALARTRTIHQFTMTTYYR